MCNSVNQSASEQIVPVAFIFAKKNPVRVEITIVSENSG